MSAALLPAPSDECGSASADRGLLRRRVDAVHQAFLGQLVRRRRLLVFAAHAMLVVFAYLTAYLLRFDFRVPPSELAVFWATVPHLLALRLLAFAPLGIYRGYWRHASLQDLIGLALAVTVSSAAFVVTRFLYDGLTGISRAVLVLDWVMTIFLAGGARFAARFLRESQMQLRSAEGRRTLIVGAGEAAETLLRQFMRDTRCGIRVVGLVDDDPLKAKVSLHGVSVIGTTEDLPRLAARYRAELIVIAIPSATGKQVRRIVQRCIEAGTEFKVVPSLHELLEGRADLSQLREVQIDDLLGREPVTLDLQRVERDLAGRVVLVTGGAGSIGSELARQIARFKPARLVLVEKAESPLYFVHLEITGAMPDVEVIPVIADVTDGRRLDQVFAQHRPDYVFHAAAYKHVPMMESNVVEAIRNNVMGTMRVAECAARYEAQKFVLISTDKAVNPTSVMGATKRVAERIVLGCPVLRSSRTDFRAVRFGNVLGSDGSVVPLFKRQLAAGGPLTVTHPDVRRYFMTIPEAVQLVLQAAALPEAAGRICMLDMGEPVKILDLAEQMIRLSGRVPHRDVQIVFTGLRPGEKLNEELASQVEASVPTVVEKIRILQRAETDGELIESRVQRLAAALAFGTDTELLQEMAGLVPEYRPRRPHGSDVEVSLTARRMVADIAVRPPMSRLGAVRDAAPATA